MANCNTCSYFHTISATTYTADTSLVLTLTNSTNISNKQNFCLCVNKNISNVVTGSPVQVYVNINGTNIPVYTKFGSAYPLYSDLLAKYYRSNKLLCGHYINNDDTVYLQLTNVPRCNCANVSG